MRPRKEPWNLGIVSPQALATLEDAAKSGLSVDMTVEIAGYEGEWFDPYDVEGYLAEKGISLDPASPFAVIELPAGSDSASLQSIAKFDREQEEHLNAADDSSADIFGMSIEDLDVNGISWLDDSARSPSLSLTTPHRAFGTVDIFGTNEGSKTTKTMIVDVAKFVKGEIVLCFIQFIR
jgi:hypothetical protein